MRGKRGCNGTFFKCIATESVYKISELGQMEEKSFESDDTNEVYANLLPQSLSNTNQSIITIV